MKKINIFLICFVSFFIILTEQILADTQTKTGYLTSVIQSNFYEIEVNYSDYISISLTNIPSGSDYDLYLWEWQYAYDFDTGAYVWQWKKVAVSNNWSNTNESISHSQTPVSPFYDATKKVYYSIGVYCYSGGSSQYAYSLTYTYPNDTDAPYGASILINSGATYANNTSVNLSLSASDSESGVSEMLISNYSNFSGANWGTYSTAKYNWPLLSGDGTKNVYFKVRDNTTISNESSTVSDSIILDQTEPYTYIYLSGTVGNDNWYKSNVTVTLSPYDATSGVNKTIYRFYSFYRYW